MLGLRRQEHRPHYRERGVYVIPRTNLSEHGIAVMNRDKGLTHEQALNWTLGIGCVGMPPLPQSNANPRGDSLTRCDRKNPRLPRSAFPCSTSFSGRVPIHRSFRTILNVGVCSAA